MRESRLSYLLLKALSQNKEIIYSTSENFLLAKPKIRQQKTLLLSKSVVLYYEYHKFLMDGNG